MWRKLSTFCGAGHKTFTFLDSFLKRKPVSSHVYKALLSTTKMPLPTLPKQKAAQLVDELLDLQIPMKTTPYSLKHTSLWQSLYCIPKKELFWQQPSKTQGNQNILKQAMTFTCDIWDIVSPHTLNEKTQSSNWVFILF